jgi:pimeloyl-ACP methyl ester carboxylesterase
MTAGCAERRPPVPSQAVDVRRVEVAPGVELHVHDHAGSGRPFVLVHGLASNLRMWDGVAAELAGAGHRVVAVDLRGHGLSDKPAGGYDVPGVAADLRALVRALDLEQPWVAGQSWGGNVVLELAWASPEDVAGVACVDGGWIELADRFADWEACRRQLTPPPTAGMAATDLEQRFRAMHPSWPEAGIAGALACFERRADGTVAPWLTLERHLLVLQGLWQHRPSSRYPEVAVPVLLVPARRPGDEDLGGTDAVAAAARALPASRTVVIEGDHDLHAQHPEQVAAALLAAERELAVR